MRLPFGERRITHGCVVGTRRAVCGSTRRYCKRPGDLRQSEAAQAKVAAVERRGHPGRVPVFFAKKKSHNREADAVEELQRNVCDVGNDAAAAICHSRNTSRASPIGSRKNECFKKYILVD